MASLHLCYAAAGAGKTHKLVYTYLRHALADPAQVRHILAITFTNKAMQEMKTRILDTLYTLSQGLPTSMDRELMEVLQCDAKKLQTRATVVLKGILHYYEEFGVTTIDGFFQQLVRTFTTVLALPSQYDIILNEQELLHQAMATLWATLSDYPTLEKGLIAVATDRMQWGKSWDCTRDVMNLGHAVLLQGFLGEDLNIDRQELERLHAFFQQRKEEANLFSQRLADLAGELLTYIAQGSYTAQDFAWGKFGIISFLQKVHEGKVVTPGTRVRQTAKEATAWLSRTGQEKAGLISLVNYILQPLLHKLIATYHANHRHYATTQALQSLYYALTTTTRLRELLMKQQVKMRNIPITALPSLLQKLVDGASTDFIYANMGRTYTTFLLDEFQDVSMLQWNRLCPLLQYAIDHQGEVFLLGDVKQAIYRWRGGDAQLFLTKATASFPHAHVEQQVLPYNWRSASHIVNFNNALFPSTAHAIVQYLKDCLIADVEEGDTRQELLQDIEQIQQTYAHTTQEVPPAKKTAYPGYVSIRFCPKKGPDGAKCPWKETALTHTITHVEALQRQGYSLADIGILVRNHKEATLIAKGLQAYKKSASADSALRYEATTSAGRSLAENPYVELLIHALRYLHTRAEGMLLVTLVHLYQTYGGGTHHKKHDASYWEQADHLDQASPYLPNAFVQRLSTLIHLPLYALVCKLIQLFELHEPKAHLYVHAFQEAVYAFGTRGGHLGEFLVWWEKEGKKQVLPASSTGDAIRIITIHQAKGLAFDIVILPFCTWAFDHPRHSMPILWKETSQQPFDSLGKAPIYYSKRLKDTYYRNAYYQERVQAYLDSLNLLYVAFTRAREGLLIFAPTHGDSLDAAGNILQSICKKDKGMLALPWAYKQKKGIMTQTLGTLRHRPTPSKLPTSPTDTTSTGLHLSTTHHEALLMKCKPTHGTKGTWWHSFLAKVATRQDIPRILNDYVLTHQLTHADSLALLEEIERWWAHPALVAWFSEAWLVKRETAILLEDGSTLRPDRVMLKDRHAVVLDFKTGKASPADHKQVSTYIHLLQRMGYSPVQGYLFYTVTQRLVPVNSASH